MRVIFRFFLLFFSSVIILTLLSNYCFGGGERDVYEYLKSKAVVSGLTAEEAVEYIRVEGKLRVDESCYPRENLRIYTLVFIPMTGIWMPGWVEIPRCSLDSALENVYTMQEYAEFREESKKELEDYMKSLEPPSQPSAMGEGF